MNNQALRKISLEALLPVNELTELGQLVSASTAAGAQTLVFHSATSGVTVVGVCQAGELLTWFASPAADAVESLTVQAVVLAGLELSSRVVGELLQAQNVTVAKDMADAVLQKMKMH